MHLWWARRPLAAARAVIFAQMVDGPSADPDLFPAEAKQEKERERPFRRCRQCIHLIRRGDASPGSCAAEALAYNSLVQNWPEITRLAREGGRPRSQRSSLLKEDE